MASLRDCLRTRAVAFAATLTLIASAQSPERARDWGIPFAGKPGPLNAITDVPGVWVGMTTLISGEGPLVKGKGPIRTGVTAILPRGKAFDPVYAGWDTFNGNGDMTGTHWIAESGFLETPILITNTGNVGIARMGGKGGNGSGDIFLAFATGSPGAFNQNSITSNKQFPNDGMDPFFTAVAEATEEAILNALVAGRDMTGIQGNSVRGLPKKEVQEFLKEHALLGAGFAEAQTPTTKRVEIPTVAPRPEDVGSIDGMIRAWYGIISGPAGQPRDWGRDRTLYMPGLRFVNVEVKAGRPSPRIQDHQAFVDNSDAGLVKEGFFEKEIHRVTQRFGPIAHVWSTYESRLTETGPVTARGINSIELYRDGQRWWIANGIWTEETKDNPIPPEYLPARK